MDSAAISAFLSQEGISAHVQLASPSSLMGKPVTMVRNQCVYLIQFFN